MQFMNSLSQLSKNVRSQQHLNREWQFIRGDWDGFSAYSPEQIGYDHSTWSNVGLPHSFSIPYFMENEWYVGQGWYRRELKYDENWNHKIVQLEFEGVFQIAKVYVNGILAGYHEGGYTGFVVNITDFLQAGNNVIAVLVNNEWRGDLAPRAGEHTFSGGIYRDVNLVITERLHIAWNGTFITTQLLESNDNDVIMQANMQVEVSNHTNQAKEATVRTIIKDKEEQVIVVMQDTQCISAGCDLKFNMSSNPIYNPMLWSTDSPYLYTVTTEVEAEGVITDVFVDTMGFRWIEWTADHGFFLNGKHVYLNGANVHQDQAGWGDAVTHTAIYRDVKMIKDAGMNFIRGSHYPHHPVFARACDEYGILFWSEATFWGIGGTASDQGDRTHWGTCSAYPVLEEHQLGFEQSALQQLREMIRSNRNRPSIIIWSMSNEPFFSHESLQEKVKGLIRKMVTVSHEEDFSRKAAVGGGQRWHLDQPDIADVAGLNGDGGSFYMKWQNNERVDDLETDRPNIPQVISEYGSLVEDRPGVYQSFYDHVAASQIDSTPFATPQWRSGQAVWCGFHHGSLANDMGHMGIVDYYRLPLRRWYWFRFNWYKPSNLESTHPTPDELRYLGIDAPRDYNQEPQWPQPGIPKKIKLYTGIGSKTTIKNDGTEDTQLIVELVDEDGTRVDAVTEVTLTVISGPGQLPSYNPKRIDSHTGLHMAEGLGAITFRSYYIGDTVITATAAGLPNATIIIKTIGEGDSAEPSMLIPQAVNVQSKRHTPMELLDLSTHRPNRASSEARGHSAGNANNGNDDSSWQANTREVGEWWMLDLEGVKFPQHIKLKFAIEAAYQIVVEGSADSENWSTLLDYQHNTDDIDRIQSSLEQSACRYIKVSFVGLPSGISANLKSMELLGTNNK